MIVVQKIQILWTKETRGAPRANERAALPRVLSILPSREKFSFCSYQMLEESGFTINLKEQQQSDRMARAEGRLGLVEGSLVLREEVGVGLKLGLRWSSADGQPKRYPRPEVIHLTEGQWAQLIMNGRHTNYSGQFYSEDIYNVAYGESIAPNVFTSRAPDHTFSLAADLF